MARRNEGLQVRMQIDGVQETLKAFRALPKEANAELRRASLEISRLLAQRIAAAGRREGGQAALLAGTAKAKYDRAPAVKVGGAKAVGRHGTPAWQLLIGSEFGHGGQGGKGEGSRDFAPHGFERRQSPEGIWIFPTVRRNESDIAVRWQQAADLIVRKFGEG